jgi:hypothetical protein
MNASPNLGPGGTLGPPTPKPIYPDTPWWTNLVTAVVVAAVSILGTAYALGGSMPAGQLDLGAAGIAVDTITYMPHILLLFGILADMFTYQGVWSIPSLVGLLSVLLNYFMQYFWKGLEELWNSGKNVATIGSQPPAVPPAVGGKKGGKISDNLPAFFKKYDGCSVQGFEGWSTPYAPQTLVVTATVFCYYIIDISKISKHFCIII